MRSRRCEDMPACSGVAGLRSAANALKANRLSASQAVTARNALLMMSPPRCRCRVFSLAPNGALAPLSSLIARALSIADSRLLEKAAQLSAIDSSEAGASCALDCVLLAWHGRAPYRRAV